MLMGDWFEKWFNSPYYHILYHQRYEAESDAFMKRLVQLLNPPSGASMLDIACGKGRPAQVLASFGYNVTGIDLSEESVREAQVKAVDTLQFYRHDIRLPFWINYFDYAFNFFSSFGYFRTERENENALRTIAQSLRPNGYFVMDYLNVHYAENHLIHKQEDRINGVQFNLTKWFDETHFYKKIEIIDELLEEPLVYTEQITKYSLGDMTELLAFQNLQIQEVYGDYYFGNYDLHRSPRMMLVAKKIQPLT